MPTFVRTDKCDGCKDQDKTACMYICPHDLMTLDKDGSATGYDMDSFREFIAGDGFRDMFDMNDEECRRLDADEDELLKFSLRFLGQVLFGEMTIPVKDNAREQRISRRSEVWEQRREEEVARHLLGKAQVS